METGDEGALKAIESAIQMEMEGRDFYVTAAQKAAENLHRNPSFSPIVAAFEVSAPTNITEQAIWASPWAASHYGNGPSWHTTAVPGAKAPARAR